MINDQELSEALKEEIHLHDKFVAAHPSQSILEDVSLGVLPEEERGKNLFRSDRDNFYVAFSDNPENLKPDEEGCFPNVHLKKIPVYTGPRKTGEIIKGWIDATREAEKEE